MNLPHVLNFYLHDGQQGQALAGKGIFGKVCEAVKAAGWTVELRDDTETVGGPGFHLVYNRPVAELNCLSLRRCYLGHFYRIEPTNDRWNWEVASLKFDATGGKKWFQSYWQTEIFKDHAIHKGGYIFMPLQGKLLERRHFQVLSPIDMIKATLAADPTRHIYATLHPREVYSDAERKALTGLSDRFHLSPQPSLELLAGCDYVVTENSSLGLMGMFASKPLVLFARIDFHHIAGSVPRLGIDAAFDVVNKPTTYAPYLHWLFKEQAISAAADNAVDQILLRLRHHGWPI